MHKHKSVKGAASSSTPKQHYLPIITPLFLYVQAAFTHLPYESKRSEGLQFLHW